MMSRVASAMAEMDEARNSSSVHPSANQTEGLRDIGTVGNNPDGLPTNPAGNDGINNEQDPVRDYLVSLSEAEAYVGYARYIRDIISGCTPTVMTQLIGLLATNAKGNTSSK